MDQFGGEFINFLLNLFTVQGTAKAIIAADNEISLSFTYPVPRITLLLPLPMLTITCVAEHPQMFPVNFSAVTVDKGKIGQERHSIWKDKPLFVLWFKSGGFQHIINDKFRLGTQ